MKTSNEYSYEINDLIQTFHQHQMQAEESRKESLARFTKDFPSDKIPEHLENEFNLAYALKMICMEISTLRLNVKNLQKSLKE